MNHRISAPLTALALVAAALLPAEALADGAGACGDIDLWGLGECSLVVSGECHGLCEPLHLVGACSGECQAAVDVACEASCSSACVTECEVDPGHFDCQADCSAACEAQACAQCGTDGECRAVVEAHCSAACDVQCSYVPPSASCETKCEASCTGSCEVDANVDCYVDCAVELEGGCEVDCLEPEGALFCDGQYIPVDDLDECLAELGDFDIEVEGSGRSSATIHCATAGGRAADAGVAAWLALLGLVAWRRRR